MEPIKVKNVVATFRLRRFPFTPQEYLAIANRSPNSEYRPQKFHAIIQRLHCIPQKSSTALIFRSTKVVLTGAGACRMDAESIGQQLCRRIDFALQHIHGRQKRRCRVNNLLVRNMVGSVRLPFKVPAPLCLQHSQWFADAEHKWALIFDATVFPALRCKITSRDGGSKKIATILAFNNGKMIITGVKCETMLKTIYEKFYKFIDFVHKN
jgi:TATA-box binding protein (TBP) (component of TFIID and TFIIIB)